jgi:uncharacterized protein (TIGR02996 family)
VVYCLLSGPAAELGRSAWQYRKVARRVVVVEERFFRAIRADPANEHSWVSYADWLEEQGDARHEVLRILLVTGAPANVPYYPDLYPRWQELQNALSREWLDRVSRLRAGSAGELELVFPEPLWGIMEATCVCVPSCCGLEAFAPQAASGWVGGGQRRGKDRERESRRALARQALGQLDALQEMLERHAGGVHGRGLNWNWKCAGEAAGWLRQWQDALVAGLSGS